MGPNADDRLAALEHNLSALREWHQHKTSDLDQHVRSVERELGNVRAAVYHHEEQREAERKDELRSTIRWELGGVALFLSGTVLSVLGSRVDALHVRVADLHRRTGRNAQ